MASLAVNRAGGPLLGDLRRLLAARAPDGQAPAGDSAAQALAARSLASVGLVALAALPPLLLASLAAETPLAPPAAIALGYLVAAHAISAGQRRRARAWSLAVAGGLTGWTLLSALGGASLDSAAGLAAVLLGPLFAGAPALASYLFSARAARPAVAAEGPVACLDAFAPSEAVLFVDAGGAVVTATRAGLAALGIAGKSGGADITRLLHPADRPKLIGALARCSDAGAGEELVVRTGNGGDGHTRWAARLAPGPAGSVAVRLSPAPAAPEAVWTASPPAPRRRAAGPAPRADLQDAISFALRHCGPKAQAAGVPLICEGESSVTAACEAQLCRRIAQLLLDAALMRCRAGNVVRIEARSLRGAALLRVSLRGAGTGAVGAGVHGTGLAALQDLVDRAGGSLVAEDTADGFTADVRLLAQPATRPEPKRDAGDAAA